jgi:3-oxoacyl-[acyl-carrier protein] reductase
LPKELQDGLLSNKVVVITGACGALGMAMAERFFNEGANLVLTDLSAERLALAKTQLGAGDRVLTCVANATSETDTNGIVEAAKSAFGGINVWINNAGLARDATMRKMTVDDFETVIDVHLKGAWLGTRAAANWMRDKRPRKSALPVFALTRFSRG